LDFCEFIAILGLIYLNSIAILIGFELNVSIKDAKKEELRILQ